MAGTDSGSGRADKLAIAAVWRAQEVVEAYYGRFADGNGTRLFGPIDPEVKALRAALGALERDKKATAVATAQTEPSSSPSRFAAAPQR